MEYFTIAAFLMPIIIVSIMAAWGASGWKTNVQGAILLVLGSVETFDWSFVSPEPLAAFIAGSGVAVLLASKFTKRAE